MSNIVVVGSSNTDMVLNVPDIPKPGQTLSGSSFNTTGGGKGANQAVAAARAGSEDQRTYFVACVGDDELGEAAVKSYVNAGVDTEYVRVVDGESSGVALIFVAESGENSIGINPGANARLSRRHVQDARKVIEESEVLLTQLESPLETVIEALKIARNGGTRTILNPAPARDLPEEIFSLLDFFTPNQTETEMYTGVFPDSTENAVKAADILLGKGVGNVIITMGSEGSFCKNNEIEEFVPAVKVKAVDTVAAGDTYNGALAAAIARSESLADAIRFATIAAGIAVTRRGAQDSAPCIEEILKTF